MHHESTAMYERSDDWVIACCPEVLGASGQARSRDDAHAFLADAITPLLDIQRESGLRECHLIPRCRPLAPSTIRPSQILRLRSPSLRSGSLRSG